MLHVCDFLHYLYVEAPIGFGVQDCEPFKTYLEAQISQHQPAIHSIQVVNRESLYHFKGNQQFAYVKITVTDPKYINKVRGTIESGQANWKGMWKPTMIGNKAHIQSFDSIQYVLRFMIDCEVCSSYRYSEVALLIHHRYLECPGLKFPKNHINLSLSTNGNQIVR